MRWMALVLLSACAGMHAPSVGDDVVAPGDARPDAPPPVSGVPVLGAHPTPDGSAVEYRVASTRATRIELELFDDREGFVRAVEMTVTDGVWFASVPTAQATQLYGYRAWGPNWPYDPAWQPGTTTGWIADVDSDGNRMNPNKLLIDPYAEEITHDPAGQGGRDVDNAAAAPKSIVLDEHGDTGTHPTRPLRDDVIYEVHVRGLTEASAIACAGTYAGAATEVARLAALGVTAVEFQPLQETSNDRNDVDPTSDSGDNYWGYSTLAYFAPDRRYACDKTPGGPTREFRAMVAAFHARGIKVLVDVVYNHTAEGGGSSLLSLRGLDNAGYYQLDAKGTGFTNSNGVGADVAANKPLAHALILDSLAYWKDELGVDGFRFDLAPVLGNVAAPGGFQFDGGSMPLDIATRFARPADGGAGADLIAEPWAVVGGSYMIGRFPIGWSEWNDHFRDTARDSENHGPISGQALAARIAGSQDLFDARSPAASIDYLVSHDGLTLKDLYSCNGSNNAQAWPYGPSDGGTTDNRSWDHAGDATAQRQAVRTGLALLALSQGVPMITGGDEMLRSIRCNNNSYNLDSPATWLDETLATTNAATVAFTSQLFAFRAAHPELHTGAWGSVAFHAIDGSLASSGYLADSSKPVLAWQQGNVYAAYNRGASSQTFTLPAAPAGLTWVRVADTTSGLEPDNFSEHRMQQATYGLAARSLALFEARP